MWHIAKKKVYPDDKIHYYFSSELIPQIEQILKDYSENDHEGFIYLAGTKEKVNWVIDAVIAPTTDSESLRTTTTRKTNFKVIKALRKINRVHLGQLHTHPSNFTDHSRGDDMKAAFRFPGMISIVVPYYGKSGVIPFEDNGIHRYDLRNNDFIRFSEKYIKDRFHFTDISGILEDLRE